MLKSAKAAAERAEKIKLSTSLLQMLKVEFMPTYLNNWLTICLALHVIVVQQHARQVERQI